MARRTTSGLPTKTRPKLWGEYSQDHKPAVEQRTAVGHAVRANYLYSGMADVAALTGDRRYLEAITAIWENVVGRKLHLTGGCGARASGEAYGDDYELPHRCYNETCAAVAFLFWLASLSGAGAHRASTAESVALEGPA